MAAQNYGVGPAGPARQKDCVITNVAVLLRPKAQDCFYTQEEWRTAHHRKVLKLNGILRLPNGFIEKWLLLSRSAIRRNDLLLGFPFATSFLLPLCLQI